MLGNLEGMRRETEEIFLPERKQLRHVSIPLTILPSGTDPSTVPFSSETLSSLRCLSLCFAL